MFLIKILKLLIIISVMLVGCGESQFIWEDDEEASSSSNAAASQLRPLDSAKISNSTLTNLNDIITKVGMAKLHQKGHFGQGVKIAIFDNGYTDLSFSLGTRLPPNLQIQPYVKNEPADTIHGTKMAELAYGVATGSTRYSPSRPGPELLLYNTNGLTNFKHAINDAIVKGVDFILYAQIWEYGGNRDGHGFINQYVNRAINAGIIWINAAGNYGRSTHSGGISIREDSSVKLPYKDDSVRLTVEDSLEPFSVKITLGWNDFRDDMRYATTQDLDLIVKDKHNNVVASSRLKQDGVFRDVATEGVTAHAREVIKKRLAPGTYYLQVKANTRNFSPSSKLWIAANGAEIEQEDAGDNDSIFMPAGNPKVIAVGAADVNYSSSRPDSSKPDMMSISQVHFSDGYSYGGTSAADAISVGALAAFASSRPNKLSNEELRSLLHQQKITAPLQIENSDGSQTVNILNFSNL